MTQNETSRGLWHWQLFRLLLGLTIIILGGTFILQGFTEIALRENIRWTAQLSFVCFCIAFGASSFHLFIRNSFSFWILMNRRIWGISFAVIHLIHLAFLGILQTTFHPVFDLAERSALLAGGIVYSFIVLMFLTSFKQFSKMISKNQWKWLHKIGGYWIIGIFFSGYLKRMLTEIEHLPYVLVIVFVMLLRIGAYWKFSKQ